MKSKVVDARRAVEAVRDGDTVVTGGFVGNGHPEELTAALEQRFMETVQRVADSDAPLLVTGETGVGKERLARAIHGDSRRADGPFISVNCGAIPENLLESQLFGHERGAFTGAIRTQRGCFELAHGGTLFLDEISEMPFHLQVKLLHVLQDYEVAPVGSERKIPVDVRVIAATNRALDAAIQRGEFREDLYYRLAVFPLDVPPLRERITDVDPLVEHFLAAFGRADEKLPAATRRRLREYAWPGNVRELRNVVERAHILAGDGPIADDQVLIDAPVRPLPDTGSESDDLDLDNNARRLIRAALARSGGNKSRAARLLGITRRTLYSRLKLLGLDTEPSDEGATE